MQKLISQVIDLRNKTCLDVRNDNLPQLSKYLSDRGELNVDFFCSPQEIPSQLAAKGSISPQPWLN